MAGHATPAGGADTRRVGLHHRRASSAGCVLANRLTQDGHFRVLLVEGGGEDYSPYIRVPGRAGQDRREVQLALHRRPRPVPQRPGRALGRGQGHRRVELDQRPGLDAGERRRLRRMGQARRRRLGRRLRAAVLQARRAVRRRRRPVPRRPGPPVGGVRPGAQPADRRLRGGGPAGRLPLQRRLQRRPPARRRLHAALPAPGLAGQRRPGVPGAAAAARTPAGQAGADHPDPHRGRPGRRRRVPQGGTDAHRPGPPRGAAQRGRAGVAEAPHAVRRRAGRRAAPAPDRRAGAQPGGGTQPPGAHLGHGHVHGATSPA